MVIQHPPRPLILARIKREVAPHFPDTYLSLSAEPLWLPQKYLKSDKDLPHSNLFGDNIYFSANFANFPSP